MNIPGEQVLRGADAQISATFRDQHGETTSPDGTVTVDITTANGTVIATSAATTTSSTDSQLYLYDLTATAGLAHLTVDWKDDGTTRTTTHVEVVGGFYFSVAEARAFDRTLQDEGKYPADRIRAVRREVEEECERVTHTAWVPRYARRTIVSNGTGRLVVPDWNPRRLLSIDGEAVTGELIYGPNTIDRTTGTFPAGQITVEYEHGYDQPPAELLKATLQRLRFRLNTEKTIDFSQYASVRLGDGSVLESPGNAEERAMLATYFRYGKKIVAVA